MKKRKKSGREKREKKEKVLILKGVRKERWRKTEMSRQFFSTGEKKEKLIYYLFFTMKFCSLCLSLFYFSSSDIASIFLLVFHSLFPYHALLLSRYWFSSFTPSHSSPLLSFPSHFFSSLYLYNNCFIHSSLSRSYSLVIFQPLTLSLFLLFLTFSHSIFSLSISFLLLRFFHKSFSSYSTHRSLNI